MNKILLSEINQSCRVTTRSAELRQSNFFESFDEETFIYDIFQSSNKTYLIAPPSKPEVWDYFFNLATFDGKKIHDINYSFYKNKVSKLIIHFPVNEIKWGDKFIRPRSRVATNKINNAVYTLQKNNDLTWIKDWANWYINNHAVDSVIIYDNSSEAYSLEELRKQLFTLNAQVILESVPFKYGPGAYKGSAWDSDFLQYAMFEHARYFYMENNGVFINADIDELLVTNNDQPISTKLTENHNCISYIGKWVHLDPDLLHDSIITHYSHNRLDLETKCPQKWTANLSLLPDNAFLKVHEIQGENVKSINTQEAIYLHHKQISTNWKVNRKEISPELSKFPKYTNISEIL